MSIHNFDIGETFYRVTFNTLSGFVKIRKGILIWKSQFAYPSYRYLWNKKELETTESGSDIFAKSPEEAINNLVNQCQGQIDKWTKLKEQALKELEDETNYL